MPWWDGLSEDDILRMESTPTSHLVIDGHEIEILRCDTDGGIVTRRGDDLSSAMKHKGHKFKQPTCLSRKEIEMIVRRIV